MIAVYAPGSCDCEPGTFEQLPSDAAAARRAHDHWVKRLLVNPHHRAWRVHGPGGHVIGIRGSTIVPGGRLPPV